MSLGRDGEITASEKHATGLATWRCMQGDAVEPRSHMHIMCGRTMWDIDSRMCEPVSIQANVEDGVRVVCMLL